MKRLLKAFIESPASRSAAAALRATWTRYNEIALNIDTVPDGPVGVLADGKARSGYDGEYTDKALFNDNTYYESPDYWYLRKIAKMLESATGPEAVFYDIGSGKGRVLCLMAQRPFKRVVGVELFEDLCKAAEQNAKRMRGRKAKIDIICEDAAKTDLSDGTVYFLFNPFGAATMREVLKNIRRSLDEKPREVIVVYYNAIYGEILQESGWLETYDAFYTATERKVSFWKSCPRAMQTHAAVKERAAVSA